MHHRSQATRAVLAASAHYWRMHINARQPHPSYGPRPLTRIAAGPCKQLRFAIAAKPQQG